MDLQEALAVLSGDRASVPLELDLSWQSLSSEGLTELLEAVGRCGQAVQRLVLRGNALGPEALQASLGLGVAAGLGREGMELICLDTNQLGDTGCRWLCFTLTESMRGLRRLSLCNNDLGPAGAHSLAQYLSLHDAGLEELDISGNQIGDEGLAEICEPLNVNTTLESLSLGRNGITTEGAQHVVKALTFSQGLRHLSLLGNSLGDKGATLLSDALRVNSTITSIDLASTSIGPDGIAYLSDCVGRGAKNLCRLGLDWNAAGDKGAAAVAALVESGPAVLDRIDLRSNGVGPTGCLAILKSLGSRNGGGKYVNLDGNEMEAADWGGAGRGGVGGQGLASHHGSFIDGRPRGSTNSPHWNTIRKSLRRGDSFLSSLEGRGHSPSLGGSHTNMSARESVCPTPASLALADPATAPLPGHRDDTLDLRCHCDPALPGGRGVTEILSAIETKLDSAVHTRVDVSWNSLGGVGCEKVLDSLSSHKHIMEADLRSNNIGPTGIKVLARPFGLCLQVLLIGWNDIGRDGSASLSAAVRELPTLTHLDVQGNNLTDAGFSQLCTVLGEPACRVTTLNAQSNKLGVASAQAIARVLECNSGLVTINLGRNELGASGSKALVEGITKFASGSMSVDLGNNQLGKEGVKAAAALIERNCVTELSVRWNSAGVEGARAIGQAIKNAGESCILRRLDLFSNNMSAEGAVSLTEGLRKAAQLAYLNVGRNNVGPQGASTLVDSLRQCEALSHLDIGENNIGGLGAKAIGQLLLEAGVPLTTLDCAQNGLPLEGIRNIADALKQNDQLVQIDLSGSGFGSLGAKALAGGLEKSPSLLRVNACGNNIGPDGGKALVDALVNNLQITELALGSNDVGAYILDTIARILEIRRRHPVEYGDDELREETEGENE